MADIAAQIPRQPQIVDDKKNELNTFFGNAIIASGGVLPNINAVLLPKKKKVNKGGSASQDY